jgi:D-alanyl-D-alanine carboxypeptidase (penicillin-binding protein 5/6)
LSRLRTGPYDIIPLVKNIIANSLNHQGGIMQNKIYFWVFLTIILLSQIAGPLAAAAAPAVIGEAAVLLDPVNGQLLFEKNAKEKIYPASTTKILTAIIALESGKMRDLVTIPLEASLVEGSAIGLQEGERIILEDLIYALMLNSGNDSAVAIAYHIGGSVEGFIQMMNRKAAAIGAADTHFNNPNGLPDPDHYSTALDMAKIARYAMQNPEFRKIVATKVKTIERDDPEAQTYLGNHNKMLWNYDGAIGIKTGYTDDAGQCLVTAAVREGRELLAVVMKSEGNNIWTDSASLLDYGFTGFNTVMLYEPGAYAADVPVKYGVSKTAPVITGNIITYSFTVGSQPVIRQEFLPNEKITAPARAGSKAGEMVLYSGDIELGRVDLVLQGDIKRKLTAKWWFWLLMFVLLLAAVFILLCYLDIKRRRLVMKKRRKNYYVHPVIK